MRRKQMDEVDLIGEDFLAAFLTGSTIATFGREVS